jgi:hypothetical protein
LLPVYAALGLEWDPATVGSLEDEVAGVTWEQARRAIIERFGARFELEEGTISPETLAAARFLIRRHAVEP